MTTNSDEKPDPITTLELPEEVQIILRRYSLAWDGKLREWAAEGRQCVESGTLLALSSRHALASLALELARVQEELELTQEALLQKIDPETIQAAAQLVTAAVSGVDVEDDEPLEPFSVERQADPGRDERVAQAVSVAKEVVLVDPVVPHERPDVGPRPAPDFQGFVAALREERDWSATVHPNDSDPKTGTGQAASDQRSLERLARHVERVGKELGLWEDGPQEEEVAWRRLPIDMHDFFYFRNEVDCAGALDTFDLALGFFAGRGADVDGEAQELAKEAARRVVTVEE